MKRTFSHIFVAFTALFISTTQAQARPQCDPDLTDNTKPDYYFTTPRALCLVNNYVGVASTPEGTPLTVQWAAATVGNELAIAQINASDPVHIIACESITVHLLFLQIVDL